MMKKFLEVLLPQEETFIDRIVANFDLSILQELMNIINY